MGEAAAKNQNQKVKPLDQILEGLSNVNQAIQNLNSRISVLEEKQKTPGIIPPPDPQKPGLDPAMLSAILPLLTQGGSSTSSLDEFFKGLGERVFYNMVDKSLPTRREIRDGLNPDQK